MGTTPPITTNNPQNTRSTKPDQASRGLRVEVEVLDDERTSTPAVVKDLDNVSPYLLLLCVA